MLKKWLSSESGQTIVLVPILLIALVGFAGLAIDGGKLYLSKSQLQKAVDAGALAGADYLLEEMKAGSVSESDFTDTETTAKLITEKNYPDGSYTYDAYKDKANYVKVYGEETVNLMLMPVLGITNSKVSAAAKVKLGDVTKVGKGNVLPIGIHLNQDLTFGTVWDLTYGPGDATSPGWYGFLDFSSPTIDPNKSNQGSNKVAEYIQNGSPSDIPVGTSIDVREGKPTDAKKIDDALKARDGQIVYVPIVGPVVNGAVTVLGFATFKLTYNPDSKTIQAIFISKEMVGDIGDSASYGLYDSKLIE
jgi:hypothetical protein